MTPSPSPTRTVTVIIDGERRVLNGRFCALFLDLLSWYEAINSARDMTVKVTSNSKMSNGRVTSIRSSVEFFKE